MVQIYAQERFTRNLAGLGFEHIYIDDQGADETDRKMSIFFVHTVKDGHICVRAAQDLRFLKCSLSAPLI